MGVETFLTETGGSVADLITKELQDLDSVKVQMTAWIQFKVKIESEDGSVIKVNEIRKAFNSLMTEVFEGTDLDKIIEETFTHMKTQVKNPALANSRFVFD